MTAYTARLDYDDSVAVVIAPNGTIVNEYIFDESVGISSGAAMSAANEEATRLNTSPDPTWGAADEAQVAAGMALFADLDTVIALAPPATLSPTAVAARLLARPIVVTGQHAAYRAALALQVEATRTCDMFSAAHIAAICTGDVLTPRLARIVATMRRRCLRRNGRVMEALRLTPVGF